MLDAVSLLGDRTIAYRPVIRAAGIASTVTGCLLASQLLWLYQQAGRQPFHISDLELSGQIGLTVNEIRKARLDLTKRPGAMAHFRYWREGMPSRGWYDVDVQRMNAILHKPSDSNSSGDGPNSKTQSGPQFGRSTEQVRASDRTSSGDGPNKFGRSTEQSIYKTSLEELKTKKEDLLKGSTAVPDPEPAPEPDPAPEPPAPKAPKDPYASKRLPERLIPPDLLDCQQLLPEFWQHKKGVRSERVFQRVCAKLRQWTPDGRRASLEAAIASGWGDVFPPRQSALPFGNGTTRLQPGRTDPKEKLIEDFNRLKAAGAVRDPYQHHHDHPAYR